MMIDYSILITSHMEGIEAQEILFKLGCVWAFNNGQKIVDDVGGRINVYADKTLTSRQPNEAMVRKFINMDELRTMFREPRQREYLNRTYNLVVLPEGAVADGLIEVPEGAEVYATTSQDETENFYKNVDGVRYFCNRATDWQWKVSNFAPGELLWQREQPSSDEAPAMMHNRCAMVPIDIKPHQHYFKDVSDVDEIDVYEVLLRFGVTDPCLQHIVKKALCAGERVHKDFHKDLQDIADTAQRMLTIHGV